MYLSCPWVSNFLVETYIQVVPTFISDKNSNRETCTTTSTSYSATMKNINRLHIVLLVILEIKHFFLMTENHLSLTKLNYFYKKMSYLIVNFSSAFKTLSFQSLDPYRIIIFRTVSTNYKKNFKVTRLVLRLIIILI